jgi:hypothetical protein
MDIDDKTPSLSAKVSSKAVWLFAINALVKELLETHGYAALYDAVVTAIDLCGEHCVTPYVSTQVAFWHNMSAEHAQVVTAAAQALLKRTTGPSVCERPKT